MASRKLSGKKVVNLKRAVANANRRTARANKKFESLTPSEKRVQIARDVLAQLATKRLIATPGVWLAGKHEDDELFSGKDVEKNPELQSILNKSKQCTGCALGGMFMCAVERADKLKLTDLSDGAKESGVPDMPDVFKYMRRFFSNEQLEQIETAFEQGDGACSADDDYDNEYSGWLPESCSPSERMRLIMENIVVNKGRFVVGKKPEMTWTTPGFTG